MADEEGHAEVGDQIQVELISTTPTSSEATSAYAKVLKYSIAPWAEEGDIFAKQASFNNKLQWGGQTFTGTFCLPEAVGAEIAMKFTQNKNPSFILGEVFPALRKVALACPQCTTCGVTEPTTLSSLIIHLNDDHRWRREYIASWLESLDVDLTMQATGKGD